MRKVLDWLGLRDFQGSSVVLRVASLVASLLVSWLLFTWMIARLAARVAESSQCGAPPA